MIQVSTLAFVVLAIVSGKGIVLNGDRAHGEHSSSYLASAFTPAQLKMQQEALAQHNGLRKRHCVPALVLDAELNKVAQAYADFLASNSLFKHSNNGHGENLYMMGSSVALSAANGESNRSRSRWHPLSNDAHRFRNSRNTIMVQ